MNLSYWERKTWMDDIDVAIIGSGIVGLNCALSIKRHHPEKKVVVFEKGMLPSGASTKNAGFACFGSVSEILDDLKRHTEDEVIQLVRDRVNGLELLKKNLGAHEIDLHYYGGYELFPHDNDELFEECIDRIPYINKLLSEAISSKKPVFSTKNDPFGFKNVEKRLIFNALEGQLDTGKMMHRLIQKCTKKGIFILNNAEITSFSHKNGQINFVLNKTENILTKNLCIATNGFASQLMDASLQPARAQVLITKPIDDLSIKGTFHLDRGYYYFRNIDSRILFGGGRNLDFTAEETTEFGLTEKVQSHLETILRTTILPHTPFEIDYRWSGIMGVGSSKKPIIKKLQPNLYCGVRLGGMGVAIGSSIGQQLAALIEFE